MCLMAELLRLRRALRVFLWVFLAFTVVSTIYLGWHYFVDTVGGAALGTAGVWIAARGTGNAFRRREPAGAQPAAAMPVASRAA
jgi:membrane-associated phospholipid phosphatase